MERKEYTSHDRAYTTFILENDEVKWREFAGLCLLTGIQKNRNIEDILEYIFETYHNFSLEEISLDVSGIDEDMGYYFDNR